MRSRLSNLLNIVNNELKKASKNYELAGKAAQEITVSAAASPSQSGDRFHAQGAVELARQRLETVRNLKNEIESAVGEEAPQLISPPCFVDLGGEEIYLVGNPIITSGIKFVSSESTLGQSLVGKEAGDIVNGKKIKEIS
ncbi:MAG: hypothetical protein ACOYT7_00515 [Patescibacteria group bacterium]